MFILAISEDIVSKTVLSTNGIVNSFSVCMEGVQKGYVEKRQMQCYYR